MIRKFLAAASLAVVGLLVSPGVAYAYGPPEEPVIDLPVDEDSIDPGEQVPIAMDEFLPGSSATLTVAAAGVDGADIGLVVLGSASIMATVGDNGGFQIGVTFPEPALYSITATGLDTDGNPKSVSLSVDVAQSTSGGGGGTGGGGGLPNTGFSSFSALAAGAALAGLGTGAVLLSRRSTRKSEDSLV